MHFKLPRPLWALPLLFPLACQDPDTLSVQTQAQRFQAKLEEGRNQLANGQPEQAARAFSEASGTLERIQRERPDDVDAKVVEAEILLTKGDEVLAAKLMDRLLEEQPGLAPVGGLTPRSAPPRGR